MERFPFCMYNVQKSTGKPPCFNNRQKTYVRLSEEGVACFFLPVSVTREEQEVFELSKLSAK